MVKTLTSILNKVPPATIDNPVIKKQEEDENTSTVEEQLKSTSKLQDRGCRMVAIVPPSVKHQMRERIFRNPGETERSIILRALKAIGFDISDKEINDQRKMRK